MKNSKFKIQNWLFFCLLVFALSLSTEAQSTNQSFPTAVTSNEISGTIRARDVGDARLTTYFYVFNGSQGDIFINVVTKNLDGDIDVFTADGLRPLTKIRVYSDNPDGETGRVIYLRQPQKLILRVEGKTPTDDPATYRIKFAGSFQPIEAVAETEDSKQPEVTSKEETDVRVNSVGTIIEVKPKPIPKPKETIVTTEKTEPQRREEKAEPEKAEKTETETARVEEKAEKKETESLPTEEKTEDKKPEVVVTENIPPKMEESETAEKESPKPKKAPKPKKPRTSAEKQPKPAPEKKTEVAPVDPAELAGIKLVVDFKDGRKIERLLNEVLKFGVDKGILTIIAKDGSIGRYSMLDIAKITIE